MMRINKIGTSLLHTEIAEPINNSTAYNFPWLSHKECKTVNAEFLLT